ncbi:aliphatic sulfonates transport permease [Plautia stali symbiont]|nr:aliphatic sulfonates transport permease [Plautia stali symbiont]
MLDTSVQMLRNVPHLALIPLVILWFGIDESAKFFLWRSARCSLSTSIPITAYGILTAA